MDVLFPEVDDLVPHALAFARVMISHAKFEAEFRTLQGVVADDPSFGEQPWNQWGVHNRANWMTGLIEHKIGPLDEIKAITEVLKEAQHPTDDRNLLAHGEWWSLSHDRTVLTVRRGKRVKRRDAHVEWTVAQINSVAEKFDDLQLKLNNVRREINRKYFPKNLPDIDTN